MPATAFGLASRHTVLDAEDLITEIPTPEDVNHALYSAVYNTIAERIRACDGHDMEASISYLLLCCDAIAELATDIGAHLSAVHARIESDGDDDDESYDEDTDGDSDVDEGTLEAPTPDDFELEEVGQILLPFPEVEEHLAGCAMAHARDGGGCQLVKKHFHRQFPRFVPPIFPGSCGTRSDSNPEVVVIYRNVTVSHTYKYNDAPPEAEDWDNQRYDFWYQVDGKQFDIRNVPGWAEGGRHIDILCNAIDAGIDLRWVGQN